MKTKITIDVDRIKYNLSEIDKWFCENIEKCLSEITEDIETYRRIEGLAFSVKMKADEYLEFLKIKHHVRTCQNIIEQAQLDNPDYKVEIVEE